MLAAREPQTLQEMHARKMAADRRQEEAALRLVSSAPKPATIPLPTVPTGDIVVGRRGSKRLVQQGGDAWAIEPAELRRFVLDNLDRLDIRKVEKFAFVALLVGEEA